MGHDTPESLGRNSNTLSWEQILLPRIVQQPLVVETLRVPGAKGLRATLNCPFLLRHNALPPLPAFHSLGQLRLPYVQTRSPPLRLLLPAMLPLRRSSGGKDLPPTCKV